MDSMYDDDNRKGVPHRGRPIITVSLLFYHRMEVLAMYGYTYQDGKSERLPPTGRTMDVVTLLVNYLIRCKAQDNTNLQITSRSVQTRVEISKLKPILVTL